MLTSPAMTAGSAEQPTELNRKQGGPETGTALAPGMLRQLSMMPDKVTLLALTLCTNESAWCPTESYFLP